MNLIALVSHRISSRGRGTEEAEEEQGGGKIWLLEEKEEFVTICSIIDNPSRLLHASLYTWNAAR
jgi:hypothetical protein